MKHPFRKSKADEAAQLQKAAESLLKELQDQQNVTVDQSSSVISQIHFWFSQVLQSEGGLLSRRQQLEAWESDLKMRETQVGAWERRMDATLEGWNAVKGERDSFKTKCRDLESQMDETRRRELEYSRRVRELKTSQGVHEETIRTKTNEMDKRGAEIKRLEAELARTIGDMTKALVEIDNKRKTIAELNKVIEDLERRAEEKTRTLIAKGTTTRPTTNEAFQETFEFISTRIAAICKRGNLQISSQGRQELSQRLQTNSTDSSQMLQHLLWNVLREAFFDPSAGHFGALGRSGPLAALRTSLATWSFGEAPRRTDSGRSATDKSLEHGTGVPGSGGAPGDWSPELLDKLRARTAQFVQAQLRSNARNGGSIQEAFWSNIDRAEQGCLGWLEAVSAARLPDAVRDETRKAVERAARLAVEMAAQADLLLLNAPAVGSVVAVGDGEFEIDGSAGGTAAASDGAAQNTVGLVLCPSLVRISDSKQAGSRSRRVVCRGLIWLQPSPET